MQRYAAAMERTKKLLQVEGISSYITAGMMKNLDTFLKKCSDAEFHIALVGAIKAGKSTLINALLGYEYASTKVTPETAALTKFKKADDNYVKLLLYTKEEWDSLWKSAVEGNADIFLEEYKKSSPKLGAIELIIRIDTFTTFSANTIIPRFHDDRKIMF